MLYTFTVFEVFDLFLANAKTARYRVLGFLYFIQTKSAGVPIFIIFLSLYYFRPLCIYDTSA